jgi:nitrate reductase molybdenum cofactor assembly chaperone
MDGTTDESRVLGLFAALLDYPRSDVARTARECRALIAPQSAEAAALLGEFAAFAERTPHDTLEEVFTGTFDLNASCHPYVGYHMFGEAYKRSAFLLELKERFRQQRFDAGVELQDHLPVMLRFMSLNPDAELTNEIARDALLPTLEPMTDELVPESVDPEAPHALDIGDDYRRLLQALRLVLQACYGAPEAVQPIPMPDPARLVS